MRVHIQRDADIGMPHQVLQTFDVNAGLLQIGAEGMAEHVGRHMGDTRTIELLEFLLHTPHVILQVHSHFGLFILIQKDKAATSVDDHLNLRMWSCLDRVGKGLIHRLRHGDAPNAAVCFRCGDKIGVLCRSAKLSAYIETAVFQIHVSFS